MRFFCLTLLLLAGCGGSGEAPCTTTSMDTVQTQVLNGCSSTWSGGCHTAAPFGANLDLTSGMAYDYLVHAPSNSSPGNWRVEPGDLDHSFLWRKLNDNLASDGSEGVAMPRGWGDTWARLTDAQLATIRCWITSGANP
jgi:hypothetical protein